MKLDEIVTWNTVSYNHSHVYACACGGPTTVDVKSIPKRPRFHWDLNRR